MTLDVSQNGIDCNIKDNTMEHMITAREDISTILKKNSKM